MSALMNTRKAAFGARTTKAPRGLSMVRRAASSDAANPEVVECECRPLWGIHRPCVGQRWGIAVVHLFVVSPCRGQRVAFDYAQ